MHVNTSGGVGVHMHVNTSGGVWDAQRLRGRSVPWLALELGLAPGHLVRPSVCDLCETVRLDVFPRAVTQASSTRYTCTRSAQGLTCP